LSRGFSVSICELSDEDEAFCDEAPIWSTPDIMWFGSHQFAGEDKALVSMAAPHKGMLQSLKAS
jgi:hypothetical protein